MRLVVKNPDVYRRYILELRNPEGYNIKSAHPITLFFLKKISAIPSLFFIYFRLFKQTFQFLEQKYEKNVHPSYGAGIRTHDLQELRSPPKTTRPGLPPSYNTFYPFKNNQFYLHLQSVKMLRAFKNQNIVSHEMG